MIERRIYAIDFPTRSGCKITLCESKPPPDILGSLSRNIYQIFSATYVRAKTIIRLPKSGTSQQLMSSLNNLYSSNVPLRVTRMKNGTPAGSKACIVGGLPDRMSRTSAYQLKLETHRKEVKQYNCGVSPVP
jgi:hypothetical protein